MMPHAVSSSSIARLSARLEASLSTHAFSLLFLALYAVCVGLMFIWGFHSEYKFTTEPAKRWSISIARALGYTLNFNTALVILLASRLLLTFLRETPLHRIVPVDKAFPAMHIIVGLVTAVSVVFHAAFHFVWIIQFNEWRWGLWQVNMTVITGVSLFTTFGLMLFFARPSVRKSNFRLFYLVHIVGASLFFVVLMLHGMLRASPETYKWVVPPLIIYAADRILRRLKMHCEVLEVRAEDSVLKDGDILELRVPRPFSFQGGQYAEIRVREINREWHPFTIASGSHEETMGFYIKANGDWTKRLRKEFEDRIEGRVKDPLRVQIRGPFGAPCQHVGSHDRVVLISGGVGATPFTSICKHLHHQSVSRNEHFDESDNGVRSAQSSHQDMVYEERIRTAISQLYDINVGQPSEDVDEAREQQRVYLSSMLQMTAETGPAVTPIVVDDGMNESDTAYTSSLDAKLKSAKSTRTTSEETMGSCVTGEDTPSDFVSADSDMPKIAKPAERSGYVSLNDISLTPSLLSTGNGPMARFVKKRLQLINFLHTTRVTFVLLLSLIARIMLVCVASIFGSDFVSLSSDIGPEFSGLWYVIADTFLSGLMAIALPLIIILEVSVMGSGFFKTGARCTDFFFFLPLTIACGVVNIITWVRQVPEGPIMSFVHHVLILPVLFLLLSARMYRSIRSHNLLMDYEYRQHHFREDPEVDFFWTVPHEKDDEWLRSELEPLEDGTALRLHRYVTRADEVDVEAGAAMLASTNAGRPDWNVIFSEVANTSVSHSVIGVFFCGPPAMSSAVQKAMRRAEISSNLRAAYLKSTPSHVIKMDLDLPSRSLIKKLQEQGCSVRFVFREENF